MKAKKSVSSQEENTFISPSCKSALYLTHWNIILIISGYLKEYPLMFIFSVLVHSLAMNKARIVILQFNEVTRKEHQVNSKKELDILLSASHLRSWSGHSHATLSMQGWGALRDSGPSSCQRDCPPVCLYVFMCGISTQGDQQTPWGLMPLFPSTVCVILILHMNSNCHMQAAYQIV